MKQPTVLFCHAGRTGGDTLNRVLQSVYHPYGSQHYDTSQAAWPHLRSAPAEALKKIRCFYGHGVYFGFHSFLAAPTTYITLVRNPVKRIVSQYYCYLHDPNRGMHKYITENNISLEQYQREARNEQAHYVFGFPHYRLTRPEVKDLPELFDNIKNHFAYVGVTELYDESLFLLHKRLDWDRWWFWTKTLANPKRPELEELSPALLKDIESQNDLDIALYNYASDTLTKELEALSPDDRQALAEYKEAQEIFTQLQAQCPTQIDSGFCGILLQKRKLNITCLSFHAEVSNALLQFAQAVDSIEGRSITWENIFYNTPSDLPAVFKHSQAKAQLEQADFIVVLTHPGQDYVARKHLEELGIRPHRIHFPLRG